jgi:Zn-dependent peptidase ImmA (M78 family)
VTINRSWVSRPAIKKALQVRVKAGFNAAEPVNAFALADRLGIEVRFFDIPSMEGMCISKPEPAIVISSLRPLGRQQFTCAHELGHIKLEHGDTMDSLVEQREAGSEEKEEEVQADAFAAHLLMPAIAVDNAFVIRDWNPESADPKQLYVLSNYFGVGYSTLIRHLQFSVRRLSWLKATEALRKTPRQIRSEIFSGCDSQNLVVIDKYWKTGAIVDCVVGDVVLAPTDTEKIGTDRCLLGSSQNSKGHAFEAASPGKVELKIAENVAIQVRVAKPGYVGRLKYRYSEAIDD